LVSDSTAAAGPNPYLTRHGFGYSVFETTQHGVASALTMYVATGRALEVFSAEGQERSEAHADFSGGSLTASSGFSPSCDPSL